MHNLCLRTMLLCVAKESEQQAERSIVQRKSEQRAGSELRDRSNLCECVLRVCASNMFAVELPVCVRSVVCVPSSVCML